MNRRLVWNATFSILLVLSVATFSAGAGPRDDVICFGTASATPLEPNAISQTVLQGCAPLQPIHAVPVVRIDAALWDALVAHTTSGRVIPATAFLEGGKLVGLEPLPSPLNVVLVQADASEGSAPALAILRGPSARLPIGSEGTHLFLGGADEWLLVRWDTPAPCALEADGRLTETPSFARLGPGEKAAYAFPGTEAGCPSGSFTFENLGAWTIA
jgi:hypothetical protein